MWLELDLADSLGRAPCIGHGQNPHQRCGLARHVEVTDPIGILSVMGMLRQLGLVSEWPTTQMLLRRFLHEHGKLLHYKAQSSVLYPHSRMPVTLDRSLSATHHLYRDTPSVAKQRARFHSAKCNRGTFSN